MSQALNSYALQLYRAGDLAEGIIYTDWAEQYGPLRDGLNYERYIATLYLNARAAIGTTDSQTAIRNLREIYNQNPNYMNGEVARMLAQSYAAFGDALLVSAPCDAVFQYNNALSLFNDGTWSAKRNTAQNYCEFGTPTPEGFVPTPFDPAAQPPAGQQ
jgi:tetratricopeptide (TPR) repeat protein